jgi:hypothetical protein
MPPPGDDVDMPLADTDAEPEVVNANDVYCDTSDGGPGDINKGLNDGNESEPGPDHSQYYSSDDEDDRTRFNPTRASSPIDDSEWAMGASHTVGGYSRGKALGNKPNLADMGKYSYHQYTICVY